MSGPLTGVRVLELTTAWAGPMSCRILAAFGAEVLKVESASVLDVWRGPPVNGDRSRYPDREPGARPINRNAWFNTQNHGKRSLALDLKSSAARSILDRLLPTVDVVVCNFTLGVLDRLELDFEHLQAWRPDIVLVEMPVAGRGGPLATVSGVGPTMEALSGMTALTGYGDGVPVPTGPAYLDPVGAFNAVCATLVALRSRDRTGAPQHVELAQREAAFHWIGELLLDAAANGTSPSPQGNAISTAAPHDAFPARDDDAWVAIAVETDDDWHRLCAVIGRPDLADDPRYATTAARVERRPEVDRIVADWTRDRDKFDAAAALQAGGVPAAPVLRAAEVYDDAHLAAQGFYVEFDHPEAGRHRYQGLPFHVDGTTVDYGEAAPCFGQHTEEILRELGMDDHEVARLRAAGVVDTGWDDAPNPRGER